MMNNMGAIVAEMQKLQQELKNKTVEISEGEGLFSIVMDGQQQVLNVKFGPGALKPGNAEALEIMVASAFNRATAESKSLFKNEIAKLTGGMSIPNIPGLF
ncbi:MAG: Nucleoid-associated protein [Pelotomaculum sp. PtaB.Bin013]|uniref:YbaB/EbfC family nucleoid-associated protein n=1 Tax=Pelotomaculum isophthalicicum JI TaxID=947010 RepID=A0A9X4JV89_9FIRM|nr:YbaB/EbfC family nucleoid-associated protein [Pelotomaculum isophthalicicum JI]OPX89542.1 MAG: Nucleoid-associated protein [Pelotomaculum sp. PtaB.Bin013]